MFVPECDVADEGQAQRCVCWILLRGVRLIMGVTSTRSMLHGWL